MPAGRKTGGRQKGTPNKRTQELVAKVEASGMTPLDFMLSLVRDPNAPMDMRLDAAKGSAPYIHPRLSSIETTGSLTLRHEDVLSELE